MMTDPVIVGSKTHAFAVAATWDGAVDIHSQLDKPELAKHLRAIADQMHPLPVPTDDDLRVLLDLADLTDDVTIDELTSREVVRAFLSSREGPNHPAPSQFSDRTSPDTPPDQGECT